MKFFPCFVVGELATGVCPTLSDTPCVFTHGPEESTENFSELSGTCLNLESARSPKMSVTIYHSTRGHISEVLNLPFVYSYCFKVQFIHIRKFKIVIGGIEITGKLFLKDLL
jgi:hypothetical protein